MDRLDIEHTGQRIDARVQIQRVGAALEIDGNTGHIVEQGERIAGRRSARKIACADGLNVRDTDAVDAIGQHKRVVALAQIDVQPVDLVHQRDVIIIRGPGEVLDAYQFQGWE